LQGKSGALFVLQYTEDVNLDSSYGIKTISYEDMITDFDCNIYAMMTVSEMKHDRLLKEYLSEMVTTVTDKDVELSSLCLREGGRFMKSPYDVLCEVIKKQKRSNGESFTVEISQDTVNKMVWKAQVKCIYPLIERFREHMIDIYKDEIVKHLPMPNCNGEDYKVPTDVEIGPLWYLAEHDMKSAVSDSDKANMYTFKEARNKLSHLDTLEIDVIKDIIKIVSKLR